MNQNAKAKTLRHRGMWYCGLSPGNLDTSDIRGRPEQEAVPGIEGNPWNSKVNQAANAENRGTES
jgi:hypothetical protein